MSKAFIILSIFLLGSVLSQGTISFQSCPSSGLITVVKHAISPPTINPGEKYELTVSLQATKNLTFQAATAYNTTGVNQLSVLVSTNFNGVNFPSPSGSATWVDITSSFSITTVGSISTFNFSNAGTVMLNSVASNLAGYNGTFYIGFRYTGNLTDSTASYGIKDVSIKN